VKSPSPSKRPEDDGPPRDRRFFLLEVGVFAAAGIPLWRPLVVCLLFAPFCSTTLWAASFIDTGEAGRFRVAGSPHGNVAEIGVLII